MSVRVVGQPLLGDGFALAPVERHDAQGIGSGHGSKLAVQVGQGHHIGVRQGHEQPGLKRVVEPRRGERHDRDRRLCPARRGRY